MIRIDLNADAGEVMDLKQQDELLRFVTSVNIACGGHAGDERTMRATIDQARRHGLAIGAHPSFPDRENFGRIHLALPPKTVSAFVADQVQALAKLAPEIRHVKPHGALYNSAARDAVLAAAIARGVAPVSRDLILVGLAGSIMLDVFRDAGFRTFAEAFAERRYETDGSLRARRHADALISDPEDAALQALSIARDGCVIACDGSRIPVRADTLCIHGDSPGAAAIASRIRTVLEAAGIQVASA
jgi:UPF0271 protein